MLLDKSLLMADGQSTTTSGASTSYIDTQAISIKAGDANKAPWFTVLIGTDFAGTSTCTAKFELQTSNDSSFLDSTSATLAASAALLTAALTAKSTPLKLRIPAGVKRYLRAYMTVGGTGVFTTVDWDAFITMDVDLVLP